MFTKTDVMAFISIAVVALFVSYILKNGISDIKERIKKKKEENQNRWMDKEALIVVLFLSVYIIVAIVVGIIISR